MASLKRNWVLVLAVVAGIWIGMIGIHFLDRQFSPRVWADGRVAEGKKIANSQAEIFRSAAKTISPAVVAITTMQRMRYAEGGGLGIDDFGMPFYRRPSIKEGVVARGIGSGFIFDSANGYVLTNNHVVAEGDQWVVRLPDKRELEAKLVGADPQTDVAVLKIEAKGLAAAPLGDSDQLEVGDWVLAVGCPFGFEQTVTAGIISAKGRKGLGLSNYEDLLQTDAAINVGNSGGPLVNLDGEVIGINSAIYSKSGGYQGIGFAIPINQASKIAKQLTHGGAIVRGWMGVTVRDLTAQEAKQYGVAGGAVVENIYMPSPALEAKLIFDDVLLKIDDTTIKSSEDIPSLVAAMSPGTHVRLHVKRKGQDKELNMIIGTQPKDWPSVPRSPGSE